METFEKTVAGGFSCINTRLSFDTEMLMLKITPEDYKRMNIDQSFRAYKRDDLKATYILKLNGEIHPEKRQVITKILKLDENNQYGFAMTKPMPTGCIKEHPSPSSLKFNMLLESVSLDDPKGHLFVVDIEFDEKNATEREFLYNDIFPPLIEMQIETLTNDRLTNF